MPNCLQPHHKENIIHMTPRVAHPAAQRPSRLIQAGIVTLVLQFLALIFFAGQFFERQQGVDESMKTVREQHAVMISDLAVIKSVIIENERRISALEDTEREEGHPQYQKRKQP